MRLRRVGLCLASLFLLAIVVIGCTPPPEEHGFSNVGYDMFTSGGQAQAAPPCVTTPGGVAPPSVTAPVGAAPPSVTVPAGVAPPSVTAPVGGAPPSVTVPVGQAPPSVTAPK
jgi:hypothetical protein